MTRPAWLITILLAALLVGCGSNPTRDEPPSDSARAAQINVQLGLGYLQRGQKQAAAEKLSRALEQDPKSALVQHANALLQDVLGETEAADRHFRRAIELDPKDSEVRNNYGAFLCRLKRFDDGVAMLEQALTNPLYATPEFAWANIGQCRRQAGQLTEAEAALRKAIQLNPRLASTWFQLAQTQFERGEAMQARESLKRYHDLAPQDPASLLLGARIEQALGQRQAQAYYELLLRGKFPDSDEARRLEEMSR
ncbi:MAG: type IV pilus biogenesis/stability protein PilW [Gammaproteobacteria bacterium]|nr:type IV pilus biogenesis/stability protein PilW [Gammaproteobacteria bacterium]